MVICCLWKCASEAKRGGKNARGQLKCEERLMAAKGALDVGEDAKFGTPCGSGLRDVVIRSCCGGWLVMGESWEVGGERR